MNVKVGDPPVNGSVRQKYTWLLTTVLSILLFLVFTAGAMLLNHGEKLAVHETRIGTVEKTLDSIDGKLDRLLERRP